MSALKPDAVNTHDLGTSALPWKDLHVDQITMGARAGSTTLTLGSADLLTGGDPVNLVVHGSLTVNGNTTTLSSTELVIEDKTITLASSAESSLQADGAGITVAGASATLIYDDTGTQWEFNKPLEVQGNVLPQADDSFSLGSLSLGWSNVFVTHEGTITFANAAADAADLTLTHSTGALTLSGTDKLQFQDAGTYINSSEDGQLDLSADGNMSDAILLATASGGVTIDAGLDIALDADGGDITLSDGGTSKLAFDMAGTANAVVIKNGTDGDDLIFKLDAGATEVMRLDDSAGSLLIADTKKIEFGDAGSFVHQSADGKLKLSSDGAASDAIIIDASNAAGGITIDAGTGNVSITSPVVDIDASTAVRVSTSLELDSDSSTLKFGADKDVTLQHHNDVGLLLNSDNKLMLGSTGSFVQETATGKIKLSASSDTLDAVTIASSDVAGGITLDAGTAGFKVDSEGQLLMQGAGTSEVEVVEADLTLKTTTSGDLLLTSADAITATGDNIDIDVGGEVRLDGTSLNVGKDEALAVDFDATTFDVSGSAAMTLSSTTMGLTPSATFDLNAGAAATIDATSFSVGGGTGLGNGRTTGAITLKSTSANATIQTATSGKVHLNSIENVDIDGPTGVAVDTTAAGADINLDAQAGSILIDGGEASATAIKLDASHADGGIVIESGTEGVNLDASGLVSIASSKDDPKAVEVVASAGGIDILASNAAAGEDIDIVATGSSVNITSTETVSDAIVLTANTGAGGVDVLAGSGGFDLDSTGQLALSTSQAAADAIVIEASDALGGIDLLAGGSVAVSIDGDSVDIDRDVVITGTTPTLKIGDAGEEDASIVFDGNEVDFHIGLDDSANKLSIGLGSAVGTTPNMTLNSADSDVIFAGDIEVQGGKVTLSNGSTINSETNGTLLLTEDLVKTSGNLEVTGNLTVQGETTTVNTATLDVEDVNITLNKGGAAASAAGAGIDFEEDSAITGYIRVADDDRSNLDLKAPSGNELKLDVNADVTFTIGAGLTIEGASELNQDLTTDADVTFRSVDADGGVTVDNLTLDGQALALSAGDFTLDVAGNIVLDADGGSLSFADAGTSLLSVSNSTTDVVIKPAQTDKDIIFQEDGGTEIARFDSDAESLLMGASKKIQLGAAEEAIYGDGTDIHFEVGAGGNINLPTNIGLTFGQDSEKIEGDGTFLTIASGSDLVLSSLGAVRISGSVLEFGDTDSGEQISTDGTDLILSSDADIQLSATAAVVVPSGVGLEFGGADSGESISGDGTDLTVVSGGNIILSATDAVVPGGDSADDLGADGTAWRKLYVDDIDLNGQGRIDLDADADTSIRASADDVISFEVGGADELHLNATELYPHTTDGLTLGTAAKSFADLYLADAGAVRFQDNLSAADVTLAHVRDAGLALKNLNTTDAGGAVLTLQTGDTDITADDVLGSLEFQAPDEGNGTAAISVAAAISAVSEGDFAADSNATKLSFKTGSSETAAEKMALSSAGDLSLVTDGTSIKFGASSDVTLQHFDGAGLRLNGTSKLQFNDADVHISSDADGHINVQADAQVSLNVNGADELAITSTTATFGTNIVVPDAATIGSASDVDAIAISSAGVVTLSSNTASTTPTTGTLVVTGGVGVSERLNVTTRANIGAVEINNKTITMTGDTDDTASLVVDGDGGLTVTTVDTAGENANMSLVADGTFNVDAVNAVTIDSSAGAISIGADAVNQSINIGTAGNRTITIGDDGNTSSAVEIRSEAGLTLDAGANTAAITGGLTVSLAATVDGLASLDGGVNINDKVVIQSNNGDYLSTNGDITLTNGNLTLTSGDLEVGGDLTVSNSLSSNGTELTIKDSHVLFASSGADNISAGQTFDMGFYAKRNSASASSHVGLIYDNEATGARWRLHEGLSGPDGITGKFDFDASTSATLELGQIHISSSAEDAGDTQATPLTTHATYYVTAGAETSTLAAGTEGQIKVLAMKTDGGDMVVTVTNAAWGGSSELTLSEQGAACTLQYIDSQWYVIGSSPTGVATA